MLLKNNIPLQDLLNPLVGQSLIWQFSVAHDIRAARHELVLELIQRVIYLPLHLRPYTGQVQKDAVRVATEVYEEAGKGAEDASAAELSEGLAEVAQEEPDEDDVAQAVLCRSPFVSSSSRNWRRTRGRGRGVWGM